MKRLAALCALGTTLGIVAPVASASAGTPVAPAKLAAFTYPAFPETGFPGFAPDVVPLGPDAVLNGQALGGAVTGAVIITTAPTSFINTNNQVSPAGNAITGQVGP